MNEKNVLISTVMLASLLLAGTAAAAVNLGILDTSSGDIGTLTAATNATAATAPAQVIEVIMADEAPAETIVVAAGTNTLQPLTTETSAVAPVVAPATNETPVNTQALKEAGPAPVAGPERTEYQISDAGLLALLRTDTSLVLDGTAPEVGWMVTVIQDDGQTVIVEFELGDRTLIFTGSLTAEGIAAGVEELIVEVVPAPTTQPSYDDDDHDDDDHDDDDHDDDDHDHDDDHDDDDHEGRDDDD